MKFRSMEELTLLQSIVELLINKITIATIDAGIITTFQNIMNKIVMKKQVHEILNESPNFSIKQYSR